MTPLAIPLVTALKQLLQAMTFQWERRMCVRRCQGRPRVQIEEQLTFLIERGFRINDIAALFGCCRTVERRLNEFNWHRTTA